MQTTSSRSSVFQRRARVLIWWMIGAFILVVGLWNGPQLWAVGLVIGDTPCFGNGSIPANVPMPLYLVRGVAVTYTLAPCSPGPTAAVTVNTAQTPIGLIGIAPAQLIFDSTNRQTVNVSVSGVASNAPFSVTIKHSATSSDPNYNLPVDSPKMPIVLAIYNPPLGVNDNAGTLQGQAVVIPVLANDVDRMGAGLIIETVTQPAGGAAAIQGAGVIFTPTAVFTGTTSFTYTVFDGRGNRSSALVSILVNPKSQGEPEIKPINPLANTTGAFTQTVTGPDGVIIPVTTTVEIPAGAFTQTLQAQDQLVIAFSQIVTPTCLAAPPPPVLVAAAADNLPITQKYTNLAFNLSAYYNQNSLLGQPLAKPLTITVAYDDRLLAGLDESTLQAYRCVNNAWTRTGLTFIALNTATNRYSFSVNSVIGEVVFFARTPAVFAPIVIRQ